MNRNLVGSILGRSSIKIANLIPIHRQTWPPQAILVSDWLISKKSSSLKPLCQMNQKFIQGTLSTDYWSYSENKQCTTYLPLVFVWNSLSKGFLKIVMGNSYSKTWTSHFDPHGHITRLCRVKNMLAMYLKYHKAELTPTTPVTSISIFPVKMSIGCKSLTNLCSEMIFLQGKP